MGSRTSGLLAMAGVIILTAVRLKLIEISANSKYHVVFRLGI